MEKLKVGDKVFIKRDSRWYGFNYILTEVERLTKTMAVLKNGTKLINEPKLSSWGSSVERIVFEEYGNRHEEWSKPTEQNLDEIRNFNYQQKVLKWYSDNKDKFSFEQIERIYKNETIQN